MSTLIVLPTADIVREFERFEDLMSFHEGGVRGLIKETLIASDYDRLPLSIQQPGKILLADGLKDRILREYSNSPEALFLATAENINPKYTELIVELVVDLVDRAVAELLWTFFKQHYFNVYQHSCSWLGNDLMARVQLQEK
jgi:hypothetical protein